MKIKLKLLMAGAALLVTTGIAHADGELNIFNWGNYTRACRHLRDSQIS